MENTKLTAPTAKAGGIPNSQRTARGRSLVIAKIQRGLLRVLQPMSSGLTFSPKALLPACPAVRPLKVTGV